MGGCSSLPYIRSDVFKDADSVKNIYVMPIAVETTMDPGFELTQKEIQARIKKNLRLTRKTIEKELTQKGYSVEECGKDFEDLDLKDQQAVFIRDAVLEYMRPNNLSSLSLKQNKIDNQSTVYRIQGFTPEDFNPLVRKSLACRTSMGEQTDTVLYLKIKNHIAKRGFLGALQEESTMGIDLQLINFKENEIIFSYAHSYFNSDLFSPRKSQEAIADILKVIPIRFN